MSDSSGDADTLVKQLNLRVNELAEGWNNEAYRRNIEVNGLIEEVKRLRQQLYDRRWRQLSDEEPAKGQRILMQNSRFTTGAVAIQYTPSFKYYGETDKTLIWWCPIQPLKEEQA